MPNPAQTSSSPATQDWNTFKNAVANYNAAAKLQDDLNHSDPSISLSDGCQNNPNNPDLNLRTLANSPDARTNQLVNQLASSEDMKDRDCVNNEIAKVDQDVVTAHHDWEAVVNRIREVAPVDAQKAWVN
ncbi:hypothetical protein QMK19_06745 [Streptomyces sp. H10-C2]|uniref:hypothetical protein n=1 Tax=unclassified Streptomyces TaxID=2593676 RepID=UPI0024BBE17E|nr:MULTISPECIES: hypothetical protein [unclassified Streptomyces]MDJ0339984.1 hypothetical protein [Streptomyces sp. PH10-H1]MDJ0369379.1 hypothetical protein [Streptomyces sp. H10-C2]